MIHIAPIGVLEVNRKVKDGFAAEPPQHIYGGYANAHGEISLFTETTAYRVNFKNKTIQPRPGLNPGAQARYEGAKAGETFAFGNKEFRRLSHEQILEICALGAFRITPKHV